MKREPIAVAAGSRVCRAFLSAGGLAVTSVCQLEALGATRATDLLLVLHPAEDYVVSRECAPHRAMVEGVLEEHQRDTGRLAPSESAVKHSR